MKYSLKLLKVQPNNMDRVHGPKPKNTTRIICKYGIDKKKNNNNNNNLLRKTFLYISPNPSNSSLYCSLACCQDN